MLAMLTVDMVEDFPALLELKAEWSCFLESLPEVTPFHVPEWLLAWWRHFGSGRLRVFVFRNDRQMAAVLPFFCHEWQGRRQLTLVGAGVSDYLDPPIARRFCADVLRILPTELKRVQCWDVCSWQDLNAISPLRELAWGDEFIVTVEGDSECAETAISGDFEAWYARRPHGLRRNARRYLEKALTIGEPEFYVRHEPNAELVNALMTLHAARWQKQGQTGMIVQNQSANFLREVLERFAAKGILRFFTLRFRSQIVAIICGFHYRNVLYSYLSAFDPEYEKFGFGRTLLYHALRHAFENGYRSWNFLRGSEPYKFDWGARHIRKCRITVTRSR